MCCIQLPSRLTSFRSTSIKPYFQPKNSYNIELDKLGVPTKLDKLGVLAKLDKLKAPTKLDKIKVSLSTLEVPQEPTEPAKPAIKYS